MRRKRKIKKERGRCFAAEAAIKKQPQNLYANQATLTTSYAVNKLLDSETLQVATTKCHLVAIPSTGNFLLMLLSFGAFPSPEGIKNTVA